MSVTPIGLVGVNPNKVVQETRPMYVTPISSILCTTKDTEEDPI